MGWEDLRPWYSVLWAPWRMAYIREAVKGDNKSRIFCEAVKMDDEEALILFRGRKSYIIMNKYPYNTGHLMIVPYRHVPSLEDLDSEEIKEIGLLIKASLRALRRVFSPHGFNVGVNIGDVAGAGVAGHVHVHIVPRWKGDANFITIVGGTKVIPQDLKETYRNLKDPVVEESERVLSEEGRE